MNPKFGHYKPKGSDAILFKAMQCGLGIGNIKKIFARNWKQQNPTQSVDVTYHGLKMRLMPQNNTIETKILFSAKKREKTELDCLHPFIKDNGTFLDIGANIGYYSLMAAQMGAGKVLSFEPNEFLYNRLHAMAVLNGFEDTIHPCN
ncbi:MAG: FkbM family methyltransferase, partial [Pseudomonadota bacterium]